MPFVFHVFLIIIVSPVFPILLITIIFLATRIFPVFPAFFFLREDASHQYNGQEEEGQRDWNAAHEQIVGCCPQTLG